MNNTTKFSEVIEALKKQGYTDDQIVQFTQEISQSGYNTLYTEAMAQFNEEDLKAIEDCPSDEQANEMIAKLFEKYNGETVQVRMEKFLDSFSNSFLQELQKTPA